jgi:tRNA(Ile)-lysidine synthase
MDKKNGKSEDGLRDRLLKALRSKLPELFLVGVSGGVDSVALLHALVEVGYRPVVAHFDHGWRVEGKEDAAFCKELAAKYGLSFYTDRASGNECVKKEEVARKARFRFFKSVCEEVKIQNVVLGHQADDVVETYLMQLFRGGGVGARGMVSPVVLDGIRVWRPWLEIWRVEIERFAKCEKLLWREDSSNENLNYRRNWIRHELLPLLEKKVNSSVREALWRSALVLGDRGEWIAAWIKPWCEVEKLALSELRQWPVGMRREVVYGWLKERGVQDVSFDDVEAVLGLVVRDKPARVNMAGGLQVYRREGQIGIRRQDRHSN